MVIIDYDIMFMHIGIALKSKIKKIKGIKIVISAKVLNIINKTQNHFLFL